MRREAVFAAILALVIVTVLGTFLTKEFVSNNITGNSILSSPQELSCPVQDGVVTAGWHDQSYYKEIGAVHEGVDFANNGGNAATCGKEVRAMAAGTAHFMPLSSSSGNHIIIDHEGGIQTRYLHLSSFANAKAGEAREVARGEVIGYIGSTGKSTGCHLHFEIITNPQTRQTINPLEYVCKEKCGEVWCDTGASARPKLTDKEKQLLTLVDKEHAIAKDYPPSETLADLKGTVQNVKAADSRASKLIVDELNAMMNQAIAAGIDLHIQSAYRSFESQSTLFDGYVQDEIIKAQKAGNTITREEATKRANTYSAFPGHSEHQLGTAIDFSTPENNYELETTFANTKAGKWLDKNAEKHGFILSYPKGKEHLTGYQHEPWHYRYIGARLASELAAKDYKGNNQITLSSFISEITAQDATPISQQASPNDLVNYDADIVYQVKPSFKETVPYDLSEIEAARTTAEEISKCQTDACVKAYNHKEIEGLTWNIGMCEQDDEETFNALTQFIEDCSAQNDNYCSCGKQELTLQKGYDIILKSGQNTEIDFTRNGQTLASKKINTKMQLYSAQPSQREDIAEIKLSEFCTTAPDFCGRNNEIEIARFDSVVLNKRSAYTSDLPYNRKCGSKRTILIDLAPSQQDYSQTDLFTINTGHYIVNALKDTDEGLAITKLSTSIPRGSHASSIDFVNGNKNSAEIYLTIMLDNSATKPGFTVRHAKNQKSSQFAQLLSPLLQASTQEIDFATSNDPKDFLITSAKIYEKDIPVVTLLVHNPRDMAKNNPQLQEATSKAILAAMQSYFPAFASSSRKEIYPFCVESKQLVTVYNPADGTTSKRPLQYKLAISYRKA